MSVSRKVAMVVAVASLLCSFTGCSKGDTSSTAESSSTSSESAVVGNTQVKEKVINGVEQLRNREDNFLIANEMSMPSGDIYYIEIIDNNLGNAYTEYPVDDSGNLGTVSFYDTSGAQYQLFDWWTLSGKSYTFQLTDEEGGIWYEMPDGYGTSLQSRNVLYLDVLTANAYEFNDGSKLTEDDEEDDVHLYTCKVPSEDVTKAMGIDSLSLYESILNEAVNIDDSATKELCKKYLDELSMNLVYSDGLLTIQMTNGEITGMTLEAGGLGTRMYITKTIANSGDDLEMRDVPDFTGAAKYYDSVKELADYVAQYGSYEEAMIELNKQNASLEEEVNELESTDGSSESENSSEAE